MRAVGSETTARRLGRSVVLAALCCALLLGPSASAKDKDRDGPDWPFGDSGASPFNEKLDLYNLGLLGVKADDAERPRPVRGPAQSGRRAFHVDRGMGDLGPDTLRVDMLYPKGPAARAKLRWDDVIYGVNGVPFNGNSFNSLADALVQAEAGENKGVVALMVLRSKAGKDPAEHVIKVKLKSTGPEALEPTQGKGRRLILDRALAWLASQQQGGGFPPTLSGQNGAIVAASVAGMAWLGGGSDGKRGKYAKNIRAAAKFVGSNLDAASSPMPRTPGGPSWDQSNWAYAFGAMFLGELQLRSPSGSTRKTLFECADRLVARQEKSGGWAHGGGGKNALDYLELNIVTALSLSGLGVAKQAGYEVPDKVIQKAHDYLTLSMDPTGGVAYSADPRQVGHGNVGRTAGCYLGVVGLGRGKHPHARMMREYLQQYCGDVLGGHASIMIHTLLAGLAAESIGGDARKAFWDELERDLVLARAPDGSLQPRRWFESIGAESNSDVSFGDVWTTASWAVVLGCQVDEKLEMGLPGLLGRGVTSESFTETPK